MLIATELRAIELATPELSLGAKYIAAIDAAIDRLKAAMSRGRKHNGGRKHDWARDAMIDRLEAVAFEFAPLVLASPKRLWEFIGAFMDAMKVKKPGIESNRNRAYKRLPEGRAKQRYKMLKPEQWQAVEARRRESKKQNEQLSELLRKLEAAGRKEKCAAAADSSVSINPLDGRKTALQ